MRRSISPVIATVILIAITIIIGAAVAGWLLGLWGGLGDVESLKIYPDAKLNITQKKLTLTIKNEGTRDTRLRKIVVEGLGECNKNDVIKAGEVKNDIVCDYSGGADGVAGASYLVKVITESGGVYQITVVARS